MCKTVFQSARITDPICKPACLLDNLFVKVYNHRLINYKYPKTKFHHLKNWPVKGLCRRFLSEFIDWTYCKSCWYFRPSFVNCCLSNLLSSSPPPPSLCQSTVYSDSVWLGGGGGWWVLLESIFCRSLTIYLTTFKTYKIARTPQTKS